MNLNKVFVLGNLTADPIVKSLPSGQPVANFGIATNRIFYDKNRQKQQRTEFHNIVAFGRSAEIAQQYLKKGSMTLIEGRLQTRSWQDSSGNKRTRTEIITERLQLGPKSFSQTGSSFKTTNQNQSSKKINPAQEGRGSLNEVERQEEIPIIEEDEEEEIDVKDIPF